MYSFQSNASINKFKKYICGILSRKGLVSCLFFWPTSDTKDIHNNIHNIHNIHTFHNIHNFILNNKDSHVRLETLEACLGHNSATIPGGIPEETTCQPHAGQIWLFSSSIPSQQPRGALANPRALPPLPRALLHF